MRRGLFVFAALGRFTLTRLRVSSLRMLLSLLLLRCTLLLLGLLLSHALLLLLLGLLLGSHLGGALLLLLLLLSLLLAHLCFLGFGLRLLLGLLLGLHLGGVLLLLLLLLLAHLLLARLLLRLGVYFSLVLLGLHLGLLLGLHLGGVLLLLLLLLLMHLLLAHLLLRLGVHFSLVLFGLHLGLHLGLLLLLLGHVLLGLHICLRMLQLRSLLCLLALALQRGGPGLHLPRVLRQALGIARFTYAIGGVGWGHYWGQHRRIACSIASTAMFSRHCRIHRHRHLHRGLTPVIYGHRCSDGGCRYCCIDRVLPGSMHGTGGKCCACSGGCQGSASVRAAMIRASDGQLSLSLRLTAGVMHWARRAFIHIGHMHVFGAADVVDDGVRARHIGLVVVDHGRACLHGG